MNFRVLFSSMFFTAMVLYSQPAPPQPEQTAGRQAVIDRLTEGLILMAHHQAEEAKRAEGRSWLEAAEAYERIIGTVPETAQPLTYHLLTGNAHLDAARCWIKYRESRKDYSPIEADRKVAAHLRAADDAYRMALVVRSSKVRATTRIVLAGPNQRPAQGTFADIKVNQAYLHVLENDLAAAAQDYRTLVKFYPGSASEFQSALNRVEDARRKQEGGLWTRDNQVGLAAFIGGRVPEVGFLLGPLIKVGYSYYQAHEVPLPYRTQ